MRRDGDAAPPLIRLTRVGQGRRLIRVWKVRTMFSTGVDGSAGGPAITRGDGDDRITPIGRRLRQYRLDELPQVWNVVVGSMALLAPRPETPSYVAADDASLGRGAGGAPGHRRADPAARAGLGGGGARVGRGRPVRGDDPPGEAGHRPLVHRARQPARRPPDRVSRCCSGSCSDARRSPSPRPSVPMCRSSRPSRQRSSTVGVQFTLGERIPCRCGDADVDFSPYPLAIGQKPTLGVATTSRSD